MGEKLIGGPLSPRIVGSSTLEASRQGHSRDRAGSETRLIVMRRCDFVSYDARSASGSLTVVTAWDELKPVLVRLRDQQPGALTFYPSLKSDGDRTPPFEIELAPWAADTAKSSTASSEAMWS